MRSKLLEQAQCLEQSGDLAKAEQLYRQIIRRTPRDQAGYVGLVHVLAKRHPGQSFTRIYGNELRVLENAHDAGIWLPEIVLPLASLYWRQLGERQKGIQLVDHYFRQEIDVSRARDVLYCVTDELFSLIPADYEGVLHVHAAFQEASPIPLTSYDRLYPFLKGAPGDLQDSYFALGKADEWFASIEGLWRKIPGSRRTELRPAYLYRMAYGYRKVGHHDRTISIGREYLRHIRTALREPFRSSKLAQEYATLMAPSYLAMGKIAQVARSFQRANHYLNAYSQFLTENPLVARDWTPDQIVEPFVNVGTGALLVERDADALSLFERAESTDPGHLVVQFQLAGLLFKVHRDRPRAIMYLRRAREIASARNDNGNELLKRWFGSSRLFAAVQSDNEFLSALEG